MTTKKAGNRKKRGKTTRKTATRKPPPSSPPTGGLSAVAIDVAKLDAAWESPPITPADRRVLEAAQRRKMQGEEPTVRQQTVIDRVARDRRAAWRSHVLSTIPIGQTGWQFVQRRRAAQAYGFWSLLQPTLDVMGFFAEFRAFLSDNQAKLALEDAVDPDIRRERRASADLAELKVQKFLGAWIPRDDVRRLVDRLGERLAKASQILQRDYGPGAHIILDQALEHCVRIFETEFSPGNLEAGSEGRDDERDD